MGNWQLYIKSFEMYLSAERSLSKHSVEAYLRDIKGLSSFMGEHFTRITPQKTRLKHLQEYIKQINEIGLSASSQARVLSGIRAFFKFLVIEKETDNDPTTLLEWPRMARKLPDILNEKEIEDIIHAIDRSKSDGERNLAILETLYGSGLRVSELIGLKISDIHTEEGFLIVIGKGNKQRLVPINNTALKHIDIYLKKIWSLSSYPFWCKIIACNWMLGKLLVLVPRFYHAQPAVAMFFGVTRGA